MVSDLGAFCFLIWLNDVAIPTPTPPQVVTNSLKTFTKVLEQIQEQFLLNSIIQAEMV